MEAGLQTPQPRNHHHHHHHNSSIGGSAEGGGRCKRLARRCTHPPAPPPPPAHPHTRNRSLARVRSGCQTPPGTPSPLRALPQPGGPARFSTPSSSHPSILRPSDRPPASPPLGFSPLLLALKIGASPASKCPSHAAGNESLISWTEMSGTYRSIYLLALVSMMLCSQSSTYGSVLAMG
ncbi:uncharacterized protein LOC128854347 [Cuculus canorus]|uniref:uncharacterized protein LOC128854347 n=1 Tax=Cuculus canorus TaxID=55661 RepID=UPI0023AABF9E|nr:uncharacterized protein LOC128854347 [Cuculus canorus]